MNSDRGLVIAAGLALVLSLGSLLGAWWIRYDTGGEPFPFAEQSSAVESGTEIVLVLTVGSFCPSCRDPKLPNAVAGIRKTLGERVSRESARLVDVGVSVDPVGGPGLTFLRRFGPFDEISVGRGWLNSGAIAFVVRDSRGELAIPHLAILSRRIDVGQTDLRVSQDSVLARYVGTNAIVRANERGELPSIDFLGE